MNEQLKKVSEFNSLLDPANYPQYGQRVLRPERAKMRFGLILEELMEYAVAAGQTESLKAALDKVSKELDKIEYTEPNPVEQLDALIDLEYVTKGLIYETGFSSVFEEAFNRVHESNMSKICNDEEEALVTVNQYRLADVETYYQKVSDTQYVVMRSADHKVLKSYLYQPVYLKDLIHE